MVSEMETSTRLYNADLAPSTERKWGVYSITSVWFAALHNIGQYTFAAGLLLLGLPAWQVILGLFLGFCLSWVGAEMIARPGQRYGIPFPVLARVSFGVFGANLPALIRGFVAIAWYGVQTYLASRAIIVLLLVIRPSLVSLTVGGFLGLSPLGWICFLALWALQLFVITHGMETIRKFQNYAGAVISLVMVVLAVALLVQAHGHIDWSFGNAPMSLGTRINNIMTIAALMFATFATFMLNLCDFSRFSPNRRSVTLGNFWGLPINGLIFSAIAVITTVSSFVVYGHLILDPTELLAKAGNPVLVGIGALMFTFATIGVNVVANGVSPAYDFSNVFPKRISFAKGAGISCTVALFIMPWKLYSSPIVIDYFLSTLGAFLGPLFGVMMVDYYWHRRGVISVPALYSAKPNSPYYYRHGVNPKALLAFAPAAVASTTMVLWPAVASARAYSWFVGAAVAAVIYHALRPADNTLPSQVLPNPEDERLLISS